jgi:DNA invertase Pin-like site-specific DNA recombinase
MKKAAVWIRVSTSHQATENQVLDLEKFAAHHGYEIVERYELSESAWNGGKDGGEYKTTMQRALDHAWRGDYDVLIVWALDRLTREGAEGALRILRQFRERGCVVVSVKESWLNGAPEIQDVLVSFAGWVAQQESNRRSERIRAGLARRVAEGKPVGGAVSRRGKDRKPRQTTGYVRAWERRKTDAGSTQS